MFGECTYCGNEYCPGSVELFECFELNGEGPGLCTVEGCQGEFYKMCDYGYRTCYGVCQYHVDNFKLCSATSCSQIIGCYQDYCSQHQN